MSGLNPLQAFQKKVVNIDEIKVCLILS